MKSLSSGDQRKKVKLISSWRKRVDEASVNVGLSMKMGFAYQSGLCELTRLPLG